MTEPTLHPNLAKLAAAYDNILERLKHGQLTTIGARTEISQLEARDDQGVRWSIDPDTGEWVRKTALGDLEYDDTPPTYGYMTPDAFDYTANPQAFNPSDRLQVAAVNEQLEQGPFALAGATHVAQPEIGRSRSATPRLSAISNIRLPSSIRPLVDRVTTASRTVKVAALAALVVVLTLIVYSCSPAPTSNAPDPGDPSPSPTKTSPTKRAHPGKGVHKPGKARGAGAYTSVSR